MNIPHLDAAWFQNMCQLGPRPLICTGWFKVWLQGHFASEANIEYSNNPDGKPSSMARNLWNPNFKNSGIVIESVTKWDPETTGQKPAIIISRNSFTRLRLGIDDRMMGSIAPNFQNVYSNVWRGSHTLYCMAHEGGEAEILGAEVFREINEFGPIVRQILDLMRFEVLEVGAISKIEVEEHENFVVPVTVGYAYREDWDIDQDAPFLKLLDLSLVTSAIQP